MELHRAVKQVFDPSDADDDRIAGAPFSVENWKPSLPPHEQRYERRIGSSA
jgi:hypothetical protein